MCEEPTRAVPQGEIEGRIRRLREALGRSRVSAALAMGKVDVLYFTGTPQDGIAWIPREGEPAFLVRRDLERARRESPLSRIVPFSRPSDIPAALAGLGLRIEGPVGTPLDILPARIHGSLVRALGVPVEDISREVRGVRAVKSPWELERVRAAGVLAGETFAHAREILRPGMREIDLAAEIAAFLIRSGSITHYRTRTFNLEFSTLCCLAGESGDLRGPSDSPNGAGRGPDPAFGEGASARHIRPGEPILIDLGTNRRGYYADTTRIFHFGPLPDRFAEAHRVSEEILATAVEGIEGRRPLEEVYAKALERAEAAGLSREFMGGSRFLGHGVGLEIDEVPFVMEGFEEPLPDSAVLSLEPKFALKGGIVGVETTFIFEGGRMRPITSLPTAPCRVEQ
jgi:Xaa-Pro dipeptidase